MSLCFFHLLLKQVNVVVVVIILNIRMQKICVSDVVKKLHFKVFNLMSRTIESGHTEWHETRKCKYKFGSNICNNKQCWNKNNCRHGLLKVYDLVCCIISKKTEGLLFYSQNFFFLTMDTLTLFNSRKNVWFVTYYICVYSSFWARFACRKSVVIKIKVDSKWNLLLLCKHDVVNLFCLCGIGRIIGIGIEIIIY